jgi:hypothetical protein
MVCLSSHGQKKFLMLCLRVILKYALELFHRLTLRPLGEFKASFQISRLGHRTFLLRSSLGCIGKLILLLISFLFGLLKILYMALLPLFVVLRILQVLFRRRLSLQLLYNFCSSLIKVFLLIKKIYIFKV